MLFRSQIDTLIENNHSFSEIVNESITEAVDSLNPYMFNKGVDFMLINFANADMVGHTGNVPAIVEALKETDKQLKRVVEHVLDLGGLLFITADHGNAEINESESGKPHTAHTPSLVPAILTQEDVTLRDGGGLSDVAPTLLKIMDVEKPSEMTGQSLIS